MSSSRPSTHSRFARSLALLLVLALLLPAGLTFAEDQDPKPKPTSLREASGEKPSEAQLKTLQRILDLIAAGMSGDPHVFCASQKGGKFKPKKPTKGNGLTYPTPLRRDKKYKLAPRKGEPSGPPFGEPPGPKTGPSVGDGGGKAPVDPKSTWQDLLKCLAEADIEVVPDDALDGDAKDGPAATGTPGKPPKIKIRKSALDAAEKGANGENDPDGEESEEATEALLELLGDIVRALVRSKQKVDDGDGGGDSDPGKPGADAGAYYVYCWLIDWLELLAVGGDPTQLNDSQKEAIKNLAGSLGIDAKMGNQAELRATVQAILDHENGGKALRELKKASRQATPDNDADDQGDNGGGNSGDDKQKMVTPVPGGSAEIDRSLLPLTLVLDNGTVTFETVLPLDTIAWLLPWGLTPEGGGLLVAGAELGVEQLLLFRDLDADGLPETLVDDLAVSNLVADDVHAAHRLGDSGEVDEPLAVLLLDRLDGAIRTLRDLDGDGLPEEAGTFASDPSFISAEGFQHVEHDAEGLRVVLVDQTPAGLEGPFFTLHHDLRDGDLDGVAEQSASGHPAELWSDGLLPPALLGADPTDAEREPLLVPAGLRLAIRGSFPGDLVEVRGLSQGGAVLAQVALDGPTAWAMADLTQPLVAGELLEICSLVSGLCVVDAVPPLARAAGHGPYAPVWDADGDGLLDYALAFSDPGRLVVALADDGGTVSATETYVLPLDVASDPVVEPDGGLAFGFVSGDVDPESSLYRYQRAPDAPGFHLAQTVGDLDGDGIAGDRFVVTTEGGVATAHWSLVGEAMPFAGALEIDPALGEIEGYRLADVDGDGDLDLEIEPDATLELEPVIYPWQDGGFLAPMAVLPVLALPAGIGIDGEPTDQEPILLVR